MSAIKNSSILGENRTQVAEVCITNNGKYSSGYHLRVTSGDWAANTGNPSTTELYSCPMLTGLRNLIDRSFDKDGEYSEEGWEKHMEEVHLTGQQMAKVYLTLGSPSPHAEYLRLVGGDYSYASSRHGVVSIYTRQAMRDLRDLINKTLDEHAENND